MEASEAVAPMPELSQPERQSRFGEVTRTDKLTLAVTLSLAIVVGLIWVFLIAAWDHYDEPNHFQYLRLLMELGIQPGVAGQDDPLNRQIIESMVATGFFTRHEGKQPDLTSQQPVFLPGYSQTDEYPTYYLFASLPARLFRDWSITTQLYGARLISFCLYLLTILIAWGFCIDLFPVRHPLRWMVPVSIALLPGYIDVMTSVNNDVGAVLIVSLVIWICSRLIIHRSAWYEWVILLALIVLGFFTKKTSSLTLILLPITILFTVLRGRYQWIIWLLIGMVLSLGIFLAFDRNDARFYYRSSTQSIASRLKDPLAVVGDYVFQVEPASTAKPAWMPLFFQPLPSTVLLENKGAPVTLGVWMWADREMVVQMPRLNNRYGAKTAYVKVDPTPHFFTLESKILFLNPRSWLSFEPTPQGSTTGRIFYDGLVLAMGKRSVENPPEFSDDSGREGVWDSQPFTNLVRNGSFEQAGYRTIPWLDNNLSRFTPDQTKLSFILSSMTDFEGVGWYYQSVFRHLFRTFWVRFGWAHIPFAFKPAYAVLKWLTLFGVLGGVVAIVRNWKSIRWNLFLFFSLAIGLFFMVSLTRGILFVSFSNLYYPVARYFYPVILPIMVFLCKGWLEIGSIISSIYRRIIRAPVIQPNRAFSWVSFGLYTLFWLLLDALSMVSIIQYYE